MMKMRIILIMVFFASIIGSVKTQDDRAQLQEPQNSLWLGSYYKFRLSEKWFWRAEFHYRRQGTDNLAFAGRLGQIYNRHAINYIFSPNFNAALGAVVRLDFTPEPGNPSFEPVVIEPRIWHEYMFVMKLSNTQLFHRLRFEHRWSKGNIPNAEWNYRNRWRYKLYANIPLNKPKLIPGTIMFIPEAELIMQSGKTVRNSPMEDLRLCPAVGYIASPQVSYSAGVMYTLGQRLSDGSIYRQRWILRFNAYISLDFRKPKTLIPSVRFSD